jgi:molybdopterin converting factor small subunit
MRIEVRFFGLVEETAGVHHAFVEVPEGAALGDVVSAVRRAVPSLSDLEGLRVRFAVNAEYAEGGRKLSGGDVVSFIPPVGGG